MILLRKDLQDLNEQEYLQNLPQNNDHIAQVILDNGGQLPAIPPVEIHPYSYTEHNLGYDKMIIGTFPPISYILDNELLNGINLNHQRIYRPIIPFYHGNKGGMWKILLGNHDYEAIIALRDRNQRRQEIIEELIFRFIRYDDIIYSTKRRITNNGYNAEDKNLFNIIPKISLIEDVLKKKELIAILFNTSTTFSDKIKINRDNKINIESDTNIKSFDLFIRTTQELGFSVDFKLDDINGNVVFDWIELNYQNRQLIKNNFSYKMIFKMRVRKQNSILKEIIVITPFSPSARGRVDLNPIVANWLIQNPNNNRNDLLRNIYQSFSLLSEDVEFFEHKQFLYSLNHYE